MPPYMSGRDLFVIARIKVGYGFVTVGLPKCIHQQLEKRFAEIKDNDWLLQLKKFLYAFKC